MVIHLCMEYDGIKFGTIAFILGNSEQGKGKHTWRVQYRNIIPVLLCVFFSGVESSGIR